jgi:DNA-binding transcriptional regulator LsrR (DeoR family)
MSINPSGPRVVKTRGPDWMVTAATAARRFYLDGRSKVEIAEELGVSRFQVARMLDEAQRLGVVRVSIHLPSDLDAGLSDRLQQRLGLRRVIVVGTGDQPMPDDQARRTIGAVMAGLLAELVEPEMTLGVACSRTIVQMAEQVEQLAPCTVVQISGTMAGTDPDMGGVEIVARLARVGSGQAHPVYAPLLVRDASVAAGLRAESGIAQAFGRYDDIDVAVVPIGGWSVSTSTVFGALSEAERADAAARGAVGEVTGRVFDARGRHPQASVDERLVAISLDQLRAVPLVIGSAYNAERAEAVLAAVRGRFVDVLVADRSLALRLLELDPP